MKKIFTLFLLIFIILSCDKTIPEIIPEVEIIEKPINYIKYISKDPVTEVKLPLRTKIGLTCAYNITIDELAPKGFVIWQMLSKKNDSTKYISNQISLTNRTDTVKYSFDLWSYGNWNVGDTINFYSNLIRINANSSAFILANTTTISVIIQ